MPGTDKLGFRPERFAALWAGCDAANANEAEAVGKFRELRRMVLADKRRVVDVMGRADLMAALDTQLKPMREQSPEVKAALDQAAALREELTERTRNVRELAERLKQQEETSEGLRRELQAVTRQTAQRQASCASAPSLPPRPVLHPARLRNTAGGWGSFNSCCWWSRCF
jgi:flagellar motility protein MotE (MotC chaperone)